MSTAALLVQYQISLSYSSFSIEIQLFPEDYKRGKNPQSRFLSLFLRFTAVQGAASFIKRACNQKENGKNQERFLAGKAGNLHTQFISKYDDQKQELTFRI